jgi:hypothetical protein
MSTRDKFREYEDREHNQVNDYLDWVDQKNKRQRSFHSEIGMRVLSLTKAFGVESTKRRVELDEWGLPLYVKTLTHSQHKGLNPSQGIVAARLHIQKSIFAPPMLFGGAALGMAGTYISRTGIGKIEGVAIDYLDSDRERISTVKLDADTYRESMPFHQVGGWVVRNASAEESINMFSDVLARIEEQIDLA